ncbi:MAG: NAD(P)/FAD-dependent oxidoreductase [Roseburia sp.]|nr:NAD(P)/FAD-dependent oxidoreductase [Roseburia sp.]MCM1097305.1 NAD(P)/FAD-dependent oxidoreductase [Ruminococcus flavefaciens]
MKRVIVIGGGAAGMMAAAAAAEQGDSVCLIEKNEKLGKKLYITGKGRCNVTNAADMEGLFDNVCTNRKFLYSAFYEFNNTAVMDFLEKAGCPLKTERGGRVFPVSDHSSDVIAALAGVLKRRGVEVLLRTRVERLCLEEGKVTGVIAEGNRRFSADKVIVCTGGLSYPSTGSTGDGYRFAGEAGHRVTELRPALVSLRIREEWCGGLTGLSLKNVRLRLICGEREVYEGFGEMLFTHFGVSGPLVLSASSYYVPGRGSQLFLDLKPAMEEEQLDKRVLRDFEENKNRQFRNALGGLFPVRLIPVMTELSGIDPEKRVHEVTRQERRDFVRLIKNLPLTVTGTGDFSEAVITRGGVSIKEINPSTMESKKVRGLYFAGEVLDLDALTGGFNLQIAWSTGHLAGHSSGHQQK